jgi:hypothetical protein
MSFVVDVSWFLGAVGCGLMVMVDGYTFFVVDTSGCSLFCHCFGKPKDRAIKFIFPFEIYI